MRYKNFIEKYRILFCFAAVAGFYFLNKDVRVLPMFIIVLVLLISGIVASFKHKRLEGEYEWYSENDKVGK